MNHQPYWGQNTRRVPSLIFTGAVLTGLLAISSDVRGVRGSIAIAKSEKDRLYEMARIPILRAIDIASTRFKGMLLEAGLEADDGYLVYEVEVLTMDGAVREIVIDAGNGSILKSEQEDEEEDARLGKLAKISLKDALETLEDALRLDPSHFTSLVNKGVVLHKLGQVEEAIYQFDAAQK